MDGSAMELCTARDGLIAMDGSAMSRLMARRCHDGWLGVQRTVGQAAWQVGRLSDGRIVTTLIGDGLSGGGSAMIC